MERRRIIIKRVLIILGIVVLSQACVAYNVKRAGYHVKVLFNPLEWGYGSFASDGVIVNNRRYYENGGTSGCIYFYKAGWFPSRN